ncbi:hypothetical protein QYQ99_04715 [Comamonas testosteroni]|jgi:hypothetical protein|uniref:hypothetical protein n=1 Tax=Comamonas testosteroni TaxID=285 RepID=UPI00265F7A57|nr:hypothetical protein [Comamonas testosteroni]WKL16838.1 hypothetical protein QYQ99_04715 [Comamonas testosteroni]
MLFDEIENLIDYMNSQNKCDFIFKTDLTSSVVYAKVWFEVDDEYADIRKSDDFYFIKNEHGLIIGAVHDMPKINDLELFVKKNFRGKGYLSKAMNEAILPFLKLNGRKIQRITFEDPQVGEYCKKHFGFKDKEENVLELNLLEIKKEIKNKYKGRIFLDEVDQIRKRFKKSLIEFKMAKDQIYMSYGYDVLKIDWLEEEISKLDDFYLDLPEN